MSGFTTSLDFPVTNALQTNFAGGVYDAFVTKLSPDGSTRLFSTYLGGSGDDEALRVVLDNAGNAYVVGLTASPDFPITNAFQSALAGFNDAFVVELDATGTNLIYSTYLGGSGTDNGYGVALDSAGNAYVAGATGSGDFPLYPATNGLQTVYGGRT